MRYVAFVLMTTAEFLRKEEAEERIPSNTNLPVSASNADIGSSRQIRSAFE
jgi:hypothetical protein